MKGALEPPASTPTGSPGPAGSPARAQAASGPRLSRVTARDLARATATRRRRSASLKLWAGAVCTLLVVVPVALAQVLPLSGANDQDLSRRRLPPLADGHLFGTDQLGRDLLSRVLHGGQVSLSIGVLAVLVSGLIGIVAGAAAGYFGRWVDAIVSRLLEAQMSLPLLMMLLLVVALFGPSVTVITCVIAIAQWPEVARLTRSLVLVEREKPYVAAARVLGLRQVAILTRHIIPNIVRQASLVVLLLLAQAVLLESALSYLGAGPQRPFATWGRIISDGQDYITTSWWLVTLPGLVIALLVVGVNLLGDGLRDRTRRRTTEGS
ncbi:ABC transporter permease [Streptomyces sp. NPDC005962]|uniref:ABC transporter permease n=1 Tax=Streptomyces sp. NPDC005962 TaxID=3154466 RepID=UPI0033FE9C8A